MHAPPQPLLPRHGQRSTGSLFSGLAASVLACSLASCANPGPPHPPSLHLPEIVTDLTAERVGQNVHLHWTSPSHTTDGLDVRSPMVAEICRDPHPSPSPATPAPKTGRSAPAAQSTPGCDVVLHLTVKPGIAEADDQLPAALSADPIAPLAYRVRMLNPQGHSAGVSRPAIAPAGMAPPPVTALRATATRVGAKIEWQPIDSTALIELDRTLPSAPAPKNTHKKSSLALPDDQPAEVRLRTDKAETPRNDPGGTLDRTALRGQQYLYRAQRVRTVEIAGSRYELRGPTSSPVPLTMTDTFAPLAPTGLATIPGAQGSTPTIDLSWQASSEADVAGYNVYRREGSSSGFTRLNTKPVLGPAFSDTAIAAGAIYTYRVTAVDATGNESPPSNEATETARPNAH